jgi:hypothetical protein
MISCCAWGAWETQLLRHDARAQPPGDDAPPLPPWPPARSEGGTSIEDLAEKFPDKIIKIPIDIRVGVTDAQAMQMVKVR